MNLDDLKLNVYIDAIKRTRWFLLITTLLSCLLLIHMYLEQFSFQQEQSIDTLKVRARDDKVARLGKLETEIKADVAKASDDPTKLAKNEFENRVDEYANLKYRMTLFDNHLKEVSIPDRSLPLLAMTIPGNDFLPVIGAMLLVFVIAVWLNVRSVLAAIISLRSSKIKEMPELIRLHFTFTGVVGSSGIEKTLARIVQSAAFILPCLSFLIASVLDVSSIVIVLREPKQGHAGPINALIVRTVLMIVNLILLSIFTALAMSKVGEVQKENKVGANS